MTLADEARDGVYFDIRCNKCRRETYITARDLVRHGVGHLDFLAIRDRLTCYATLEGGKRCGSRSIMAGHRGYWVQNIIFKPADWADTVDQRARKHGIRPSALSTEPDDLPESEPQAE